MKELIVDVLKVVAPLSVAFVVFSQGLGTSPSLVVAYFKERPGLIMRALLAAVVVVPAVALALILVLKPSHASAIALAILVACPPAPLMVSAAPKKGASAALMASLHLGLAVLAFLTVPAAIYLLSMPLGFTASVDLGAMALVLGKTILAPLGLGLIVRGLAPSFAGRMGPALAKAGGIGLLVVVAFAIVAFIPALRNMDGWSYLVFAAVSVSALAIGHLLGPSDPHERTSTAIECGVRHPVLALTIAGENFGSEQALPVLVPCVLTFIALGTVYLALRRRSLAASK